MSPINQRPSMDPSQRALDEKNALDYSLSHEVDKEKKIEHDPVKESYKNFSIEKEGTSLITSLKNGFKNFADQFLKVFGQKTSQESSVEKYFNAGDPDYLNERDPKQQETQPQDNKKQEPKKGFSVVAAFKKIFNVTSVPKQVRDDIKIINTNVKYQLNFTEPKDGATIEDNPVSKVVISNNNRANPQEPSRFQEYRKMAEEVMAERGVSDGRKWEERVLATYSDANLLQDTNNSGVKASSNSSSGQGLDSAKPSTKTLQPPKSPAQIKPTKDQKERLRVAILNRLGKEGETNSAPVPSEEKSKTFQTPLDMRIQSLASNAERLEGLVSKLQTSTESLKPQQNNVEEPKGGFRGSETLIGATTPAPPKENTTTTTSASTRASSTATSTVANNPAHSSPTTPPSVEGSEKETSKKNVRGPGIIAYDWLNNKTVPKPSDREVSVLRPPIKSSSNHQSEVSHPDWTRGSNRNGTELWERKAKAQEAEKALAELEASKDQKKAPSRQTQTAKQQSSTSPCGHYKTSNPSPVGEASFVARLATNGTGGKGGRGAGG